MPKKAKQMASIVEDLPLPIDPSRALVPLEKLNSESKCDLQFFNLTFVIITSLQSLLLAKDDLE